MNQNYVGFGTRLVAALVDGIIITVIYSVAGVLLGVVLGYEVGNALSKLSDSGIGFLLNFILVVGYYILYQHSAGQTLGKKAFRIKVVDDKGQTPSYLTFFLREVIGKFVSVLILFIGYLMVLWDPKKQALHDKIAGTYVVRV